jgi:hypothetical protein
VTDSVIYWVFRLVFAVGVFVVLFAVVSAVSNSRKVRDLFKSTLSALIASVWVLPVGYWFIGVLHWLQFGYWLEINLCTDAGLFCEGGKAVGFDRIMSAIANLPLVALVVSSSILMFVCSYLLKDAEDMEALDQELEELKRDGKL